MESECVVKQSIFSVQRDLGIRRAIAAARDGLLCATRDDHVIDHRDEDHTDQDHQKDHHIDIQHDLAHGHHQGIRD